MGLASILYFSVFPNEGICIRLHKNIRVLTSRITSPTTHRTKLSPSRCETQGTSINSSRCQIQICGFWHSDPYTSIMCTRYYPLSISHTLETYLHTDNAQTWPYTRHTLIIGLIYSARPGDVYTSNRSRSFTPLKKFCAYLDTFFGHKLSSTCIKTKTKARVKKNRGC